MTTKTERLEEIKKRLQLSFLVARWPGSWQGFYGDDVAWLIQQLEASRVRCGECRYWDAYEDDAEGYGLCTNQADAVTVSELTHTRSDFGCIFGERKAGK